MILGWIPLSIEVLEAALGKGGGGLMHMSIEFD